MDEQIPGKKTRKKIGREFKQDALALAAKGEKPLKEIESDLGITPGSLSRWKRELRLEGEVAFRGPGRTHPVQAELTRLQREVTLLRAERDLLKKAIALVSR
jgi:transposase